jgi:hypothetical protein
MVCSASSRCIGRKVRPDVCLKLCGLPGAASCDQRRIAMLANSMRCRRGEAASLGGADSRSDGVVKSSRVVL